MNNISSYNKRQYRKRSDLVITSTSAFTLPIRVNSIYQWRILGLIMMKMQLDFGDYRFRFSHHEDLKNQKPILDQIKLNRLSFGNPFRQAEIEVTIPLNFLLHRTEKDKLEGYKQVKKALKSLSRPVEYENLELKKKLFDKTCKDSGIIWGLFSVIEKPDFRKVDGISYVYFRVPESTWEVLCNWEKGVHIFELSVFFRFTKAASIPFYILLADFRKSGEAIWPVKYIKNLISPGEYRDYAAFRKKVICEVEKDLKEHSPFYFTFSEYVDSDCQIPAGKGRGRQANYIKFELFYQAEKNFAVDKRIELFAKLNRLTSYHLSDLSEKELNYIRNNFGLANVNGKNLEYLVRLKYYKNYGHQNVGNWRTNPGEFFFHFLVRVFDGMVLSTKKIEDKRAYLIGSVKKELEGYEANQAADTAAKEMERQDSPKRKT